MEFKRSGPLRLRSAADDAAGRALLDVISLLTRWLRGEADTDDTLRQIAERSGAVVAEIDRGGT
jgi:hypothetical protein